MTKFSLEPEEYRRLPPLPSPDPETPSLLGLGKDAVQALRDVDLTKMSRPQLVALLGSLTDAQRWLSRAIASNTPIGFISEILRLDTPKHVREWVSLLSRESRLVVEASRDHGKSYIFSFAWPLYRVSRIRDPKNAFGVALFSYSEGQAKHNLKRIRKEIESNPALKWLKPGKEQTAWVWDANTLDLSNGCFIEAYGFGSAFRGRHPLIVVVDDPCKDHGTMSVEEQEQFLYGVIEPAVVKGGQIAVTGNPVDKVDFLSALELNSAFKLAKYPCYNPTDGEPLWPERYDREAIEAKRRVIPTHIFAREYLLKRVSSADAKFKEEWIKYYDENTVPFSRKNPMYRVMTIDPAMSPGGDKLAAVVTGTDAEMNTFTLDILRFRGDFKTGLGKVVDMMVNFKPDYIGCEEFAMQAMYRLWLEDEIKRRGLYFSIEATGRTSAKSKAARIEALQPWLASGRLFFRREHKPIVDELLLWDPLSKTNEDDLIDALAWQVPLIRKPVGEEKKQEVKDGSFDDVFEKLRESRMNSNWIGRMFSDMGCE